MDASVILQGLICFTLLPSLLFTASLIICGNSRSQRKPAKVIINNKKNVRADKSESRRTGETKFTESSKTQKSTSKSSKSKSSKSKLSKSKLKIKRAKKSQEIESSVSTKSVETVSPKPIRSSRWERFGKLPTSGTFTCNIDEKLEKGMKMEPKLLNWNISGGVQKVYLTNQSNERRAIKIKCSDNYLYRVSRVFSFVEPGEMVGIDILRQNGGAKPDKMIFLWTKAEKSDQCAPKLFSKVSIYPMLTLPLTVNNPPTD